MSTIKDTTAIKDGVYPLVKSSLSTQSGINKYKKCVQWSMDKRPGMFSPIPNDRLYFGKEDVESFWKAMGIDQKDVVEQLKKAFFWNMNYSPIAAKDPLTVTALSVVRYFVLEGKSKEAELAAIYLAFSGKFYPSKHYSSFNFLATDSEEIMLYIVNTQMSAKFDLKREGTIFGTIRSICITWLNTYKNLFKSYSDDDVGYLIKQLISRIGSFLKNFAHLYYESYKNKDYITYDSDNLSDDNFHLADNDSLKVERATNNAMQWITTRKADYKICTSCADQNVKRDEVKEIVESILNNQDNISLLRELMENIIADYMRNGKEKDVRSIEFISYSIVSKPNAKDKNIVRIKQIIYKFLEDNSEKYRRRKKRIPTQNSYYRAILSYMVLVINKVNK